MRAHSRTIGSAMIGAMFILLGSACGGGGSTGTSSGSEIRVLFNNQTGRTLSIIVGGAAFAQRTVTVVACTGSGGGCTTDEFTGVVGNTLTFSASGVGAPAISGSGSCKANAGIAPAPFGANYGQVNINLAGSTISLLCMVGPDWQ